MLYCIPQSAHVIHLKTPVNPGSKFEPGSKFGSVPVGTPRILWLIYDLWVDLKPIIDKSYVFKFIHIDRLSYLDFYIIIGDDIA